MKNMSNLWAFICRKDVRLYSCYVLFCFGALLMSFLATVDVIAISAVIALILDKLNFLTQSDWWRLGPFVWALSITTFGFCLVYFWRDARARAHRVANMSITEFADHLIVLAITIVLMLIVVILVAGIYQIWCWLF